MAGKASTDEELLITLTASPRMLWHHMRTKSLWAPRGVWSQGPRLKLTGVDSRATPGMEPAAYFGSTRGSSPGPDIVASD